LNQVALSSAREFLEKYQSEQNIIGFFGLGFYSAFMVADKVEVHTKSWKEDEPPVIWTCAGSPEYTIKKGKRKDRGTDVILHLSKDAKEYLEEERIEALLKKYCRFLPVPIKFGKRKETVWEGEGEKKKSKEVEVDNIINTTEPLWKKQPSELKDQDYLDFYNELYPFSPQPLFWIHLNIDYPFNLTGVLYFPRLENNLQLQKNKIQLYANQVYVTDNVEQIVPEFLTYLHGVIDSPDIPLNVSRSYLQSDSNVKKITNYITRKVADKLHETFKKDRKAFEQKWKDLGLFIKYGMISEEKFHEKALKFALLRNTDGEFFTLDEYKEKVKALQTDKHKKVVFLYANDPEAQSAYVAAAKERGYDVLVFDQPMIDNHFMQHLEFKTGDISFVRVDADTPEHLIDKDEKRESVLDEKAQEAVKKLFEEVLKNQQQEATVLTKALSPEEAPVLITRPEFMRRMKEMQMLTGMGGDGFPEAINVVVNTNHPLISQKLLNLEKEEEKLRLAEYLLDLGRLAQNMLKGERLTAFVKNSLKFVE
ncbi:MAG: molecular chaperone HtpG, partial [Bacteroidetes bacterium]